MTEPIASTELWDIYQLPDGRKINILRSEVSVALAAAGFQFCLRGAQLPQAQGPFRRDMSPAAHRSTLSSAASAAAEPMDRSNTHPGSNCGRLKDEPGAVESHHETTGNSPVR